MLACATGMEDRRHTIENRTVLLDRDGTLIVEKDHLTSASEVEFLPNAIAGLRAFQQQGLRLVVLTNQSVGGRGLLVAEELASIHGFIESELKREGITLGGIYCYPHLPSEAGGCRKPTTELAERAARELGFSLAEAFVIGDKPSDIELGQRCGSTTILVRTGYGREHEAAGDVHADLVADDLADAARLVGEWIAQAPASPLELTRTAGERLRRHVLGSIATKQRLLAACHQPILDAAAMIKAAFQAGGKLMLCGNGGSAADAQHIAAELVSVLTRSFPRPGLPAIALTSNTSILSACANDFGFEGVFVRQVQALGRPGDVLLGISTSGNSANVLRAFEYARTHAIRSIALAGRGGALPELADIAIRVPADSTQYVQESHVLIGHILCDLVERSL
jgi:D-sedoheptulose 7-phosphate isomerase